MNESGLVRSVARGVEVRDVSAHAGVDFDGTLFVDRNSCGFEAEAARVGFAACSNQQSISASFTVICHQHELAIHISDLASLRVLQHFNTLATKRCRQRLAEIGRASCRERVCQYW